MRPIEIQSSELDASKYDYQVSRVDFTGLKTEWDRLVNDIPDAHLFHTWDWLSMWWRHHKDDGALWLLAAREAQSGELMGVLPLMLTSRRFGPLQVRTLTYMFYRPPIHQTIIARPNYHSDVGKAFIDYLRRHSKAWDVLDLDGFRADEALIQQLQAVPGRYYEREAATCHVAVLTDNWDTYQKQHLSRNRRQQLRRAKRKLEKDFPGQVVFERLTEPEAVQDALETLVELNRYRWHQEGLHSSFDETRFVEFHREMALYALQRDWLRFYRLTVADEIASLRYCFRYRDVLSDYQLTFNLDLAEYRPGELLLAHVLEEAMNEGVQEFDMLRGTYRYKQSWSNETRYEKHLLASTSWRGHTWMIGTQLVDETTERGRDVLPPAARQRLNRISSAVKRHTVK